MRRADIEPGVVYAYQHGDRVGPVVFLEPPSGLLWRELPGEGFTPAPFAGRTRRADGYRGLGGIGYPAALPAPSASTDAPTPGDLALLRSVTMDDFRLAGVSRPVPRGIQFTVITNLAQVVGEWEG